jgi:hypothetical protein
MTSTEKNTWLFGLIAVAGYAVYAALVLGQTATTPLVETEYVWPMLGTILAAIGAGIVGGVVLGVVSRDSGVADVRDREIEQLGERVGGGFVAMGAIGAMILAWLEVDPFWIANLLYLGFTLSALFSVMARLGAYRRGL